MKLTILKMLEIVVLAVLRLNCFVDSTEEGGGTDSGSDAGTMGQGLNSLGSYRYSESQCGRCRPGERVGKSSRHPSRDGCIEKLIIADSTSVSIEFLCNYLDTWAFAWSHENK